MHLTQQRLEHVGRGVAEKLTHAPSGVRPRRHAVHLGQRVIDADVAEVGVMDRQSERRVAQQQIDARAGAVARGDEQTHGHAGADEQRKGDEMPLEADRTILEPCARDERRGQERRDEPRPDTGEPRDQHDGGIERHERQPPAPHRIEELGNPGGQQHGERGDGVPEQPVQSKAHGDDTISRPPRRRVKR